jgi:heme-degrading monooxygenase HmoA
MFIVVNTIMAPASSLAAMANSFRRLASELRFFEGFLAFELWEGEGSLLAVSKWTSRQAFQEFPKSELFKHHHGGMSSAQSIQNAQIAFYEGNRIA